MMITMMMMMTLRDTAYRVVVSLNNALLTMMQLVCVTL